MTGWRIGYIGAPEWIAKACTKMQGQVTSGTNCIAQRAAITAVLAPVSKVQYMVMKILNLKEIPGSLDVSDAVAVGICCLNQVRIQ